ncbi:hypothetical protein L1049_012160 [Liquidambar formosana]|uniref:Dirigent protein n=1 Tax=Liquidambar formosana TaxID=63359 RepID=A0AAP0RSJ3_LIQFO
MESHKFISFTTKATAYILLLTLTIISATSARILEEQPLMPVVPPEASNSVEPPVVDVTQVASPAATQPNTGVAAATSATMASNADLHHTISFFMHDILGGSNPSAQAVTGIVNNAAVNGQLPFAKPNGAVLPVNNGVPLNNGNSGLINNNNIPFLTGLGGSTSTVIQNTGNNMINGGFRFPINGAQFPAGSTLQKLMFGTMTVIDDELTEGHELGSGFVGKVQGFYVASSEDGSSQTMAITTMFESGSYADSLSFFGVHRTAVSESQLAIMGGTGKYVNAKGYATIKTIPPADQQTTDGLETLLQFTVYISY